MNKFVSDVIQRRHCVYQVIKTRDIELYVGSKIAYDTDDRSVLKIDSGSNFPNKIDKVYFDEGSRQLDIINCFIESEYCSQIEYLFVGSSSYYFWPDNELSEGDDLNFSEIMKILARAKCPNLKGLVLGGYELYHNACTVHGRLGDIADTLENFSHVESICIFGEFELSREIKLKGVKELEVEVDDTCPSGLRISDQTFHHLVSSEFPNLEKLSLEVFGAYDKNWLTFPETFLEGKNLPKAKQVDICGNFDEREKDKCLSSELFKRVEVSRLDEYEWK